MSREARSLLALNLGSASLKAASFALPSGADSQLGDAQETGRVSVEAAHRDLTAAAEDSEALLADVIGGLPGLALAPDVVTHRIVHGADRPGPAELTQETLAALQALSPLAPLHQPSTLALVEAATRRWPHARQIGVFDTSWHQSMPDKHRLFPIPYALYSRGVKRYGFHGLAFQSAMRQLTRIAPGLAIGRVVLAHLGGGSSLCAVLGGRSCSTTMGMTPLGGIAMSSRSGSLDPGVLLHLQRGLGMSPDEVDQLLWKESGLTGLSGESGDMRSLLASHSDGARRAIEVYVAELVQGIAAMAACIGGFDCLAFSGGIGAHAAEVRARVSTELAWLGLRIDPGLNKADALEISAPETAVKSFVLPIDEEAEIARSAAMFMRQAGPDVGLADRK
jgi:acetate kinase